MLRLFQDSDLLHPIEDRVLFEGVTYYLNVEGLPKSEITTWISENNLSSCLINFHPRNSILNLKFDNIVGSVPILGDYFDVRSKKLYDNHSGNKQFQSLLDDIIKMHHRLSLNFKGVSLASRDIKREYSFFDLEVFEYYYQLAFDFKSGQNLDAIINQCLKRPNSKNQEIFKYVDISKANKPRKDFFQKITSGENLGRVNSDHSLASSKFAMITHQRIGQRLIPLKVSNIDYHQTINTVENQFVKFFLNEINSLCLRIMNQKGDAHIQSKAHKLQNKVSLFLRHPLFKGVGQLSFVPTSSSVLINGQGYREVYYHYVQSKFAFRPLLTKLRKESLKTGLKNIATLYEIWVFYKIAIAVFGNTKVEEIITGRVIKDGSVMQTFKWQNDDFELFFNKGYSRKNNGSYSLNLRPDVSLLIKPDKLYLFDAKYKFSPSTGEDGALERLVKPEDIHKMHAYLDAIPASIASFVVYPGTKNVFYHKPSISGKKKIEGVGAIFLVPERENDLDTIIKVIRRC